MMIGRILFAVPLLLVAALSAQQRPPKPRAEARFGSHLPGTAIAAMQGIRPDNIETHVRFLSHDLLEGRGTGQRGGDLAAQYIAAQFALDELKPAGDNGSYLQKVPLVGITPGADTRFSLVPAKGQKLDLKPLDDYVAYDQTQQPESNVEAE
ncbi:MAG: peptidase M28, partial [Terriglobales bacterium]